MKWVPNARLDAEVLSEPHMIGRHVIGILQLKVSGAHQGKSKSQHIIVRQAGFFKRIRVISSLVHYSHVKRISAEIRTLTHFHTQSK